MIARLLLCLALACFLPAMAQLPKLDVNVRRVDADGERVYEVAASGVVDAAPAAVWKILTDYERMPEFVPDLQSAHVLSRSGNRAIIEQFGVAHFLFIRRDIHLIVQVREQPMSSIDIGLVTGDMKLYDCRWALTPIPETGGTRIDYSGRLVPKFYVPGMLGSNIIGADVKRMLKAVLERIDRPDQAG
jgi:ribosome-associated toxin RatA of RatAB toxin-antitoxin module